MPEGDITLSQAPKNIGLNDILNFTNPFPSG
jgi:hypothetical protein